MLQQIEQIYFIQDSIFNRVCCRYKHCFKTEMLSSDTHCNANNNIDNPGRILQYVILVIQTIIIIIIIIIIK